MKSKAKPAKGSARTKRFDVGGTVGALAGLGTLAYLMSRKKKGEAESPDVAARRASGAYRGGAGTDTTTDTKTDTTTDNKPVVKPPPGVIFEEDRARDEARRRALDQSKDPRANYMPEGADRKELYSDVNAKRTDIAPVVKKKPVVTDGGKKDGGKKVEPKKDGTDKAPAFTGLGMAGSDNRKKEPPVLKAGESKVVGEGELKPYPEAEAKARKAADRQKFLEKQAGMKRTGITTPGKDKNRQERSKGRSANPIQETIDNAGRSTVRSDKEKMAAGAREVERRRQEEKAKKLGYGIKKGGMVKKYASGGSVSSASKRADGIAQRGKTRGKVC